jgi:aminodeoxyfutalosine deaminase
MSSAPPISLRARWVFPIAGPPLRDAAVTIAGGRIVSVGPPPRDTRIEDLGSVAILPGLVNAHTHLEFSDLVAPIGQAGMGIVEWLGSVIQHRAGADNSPQRARAAVAQGLRESLRHGVTTIGEIAQPGMPFEAYLASPCDGTIFLEWIAPRADRFEAVLAAAARHVQKIGRWQPGWSPHAPYTVHPELLSRAAALAATHQLPLAMHVAESREEIEFLRDGRGPFRELLESRGVWDASARPLSSRPLDELRMLARAPRALVIHGNYLDDEEIEFLGRQPRMAVVYCPRTHAWFGHARYPLEKLLAAGVNVALGTDSRASSPDLSLMAELKHVARTFPALSRATILELGTLGGARALGLDSQIGSLEPGKTANLAVAPLPDTPADPYELLLDSEAEVSATWIRGECTVLP